MKLIAALTIMLVVFLLESALYERLWNKHLSVSIEFEAPSINEGQKSYLVETIENNKRLPVPFLQIKFATSKFCLFSKSNNGIVTDQYYRSNLYSIAGKERITRKYPFICTKRGTYQIPKIDILSHNFFLYNTYAIQKSSDTVLYVKPSIFPYRKLPDSLVSAIQKVIDKYAVCEDPFEFKGIRQYQPYDNIRHINWKCTAKYNELQVNTYFPTTSKEVDIYLNLETNTVSHMELLQERAIRYAYSIASMLTDAFVSFSVISNGVDIFTHSTLDFECGSGRNHLNQLGIAFARMDLTQKVNSIIPSLQNYVKAANQNHQLILITNYRKTDLQKVYQELISKGVSCCAVIPECKEITIAETGFANSFVLEVDYRETSDKLY